MINEGTKILIKYKNFTDKDLIYIIRLVNKEFNIELENFVGKPEKGTLQAPLEINDVKTGNSITIEISANPEIIAYYLVYKMGVFLSHNLSVIVEEKCQDMLRNAIDKAMEKFKRRRREDNLEDFSYQ